MLRMSLAAGAVALSLAMPVFAQDTSSGGGPNSNGTMQSGSMQMQNGGMNSASMSNMDCNQLLLRAQSKQTQGTGAQMAVMQKELNMANQAKANNDMAGCKMHAMKAMQGLK